MYLHLRTPPLCQAFSHMCENVQTPPAALQYCLPAGDHTGTGSLAQQDGLH